DIMSARDADLPGFAVKMSNRSGFVAPTRQWEARPVVHRWVNDAATGRAGRQAGVYGRVMSGKAITRREMTPA
ncbi:MAG: hypothetical protein ACJ8AW_03010, partial [Rhodopila sp.]